MTVPDNGAPPVNPDAPLRLSDAAKLAFPMGGMTASGLRREAARGRLDIERIAGKDFTTLRAIEEMRQRCRVTPKAPVSISIQAKAARQFGSLGMDKIELALAAARLNISTLRNPSAATPPLTPGRRGANRLPK
jgi:hypothetical protein